jgi:hypothetical protein
LKPPIIEVTQSQIRHRQASPESTMARIESQTIQQLQAKIEVPLPLQQNSRSRKKKMCANTSPGGGE